MRFRDDIEFVGDAFKPRRQRAVDDEVTLGLAEGRAAELVEGADFPEGQTDRVTRRLRDRARSRGLTQSQRSEVNDEGKVVIYVHWYRDTPGDLRNEVTPPRLQLDGVRSA